MENARLSSINAQFETLDMSNKTAKTSVHWSKFDKILPLSSGAVERTEASLCEERKDLRNVVNSRFSFSGEPKLMLGRKELQRFKENPEGQLELLLMGV